MRCVFRVYLTAVKCFWPFLWQMLSMSRLNLFTLSRNLQNVKIGWEPFCVRNLRCSFKQMSESNASALQVLKLYNLYEIKVLSSRCHPPIESLLTRPAGCQRPRCWSIGGTADWRIVQCLLETSGAVLLCCNDSRLAGDSGPDKPEGSDGLCLYTNVFFR